MTRNRLNPFATAGVALIAGALLSAAAVQAASPAVEAALSLPRTEPKHYVQAALALSDLRATAEAEVIVGELLKLPLDDAALARLVGSVGTARLTRLGRQLPATAPLVDRALEAAFANATSPERLQRLVDRLGGDRDQAIDAIRSLRETGATGAEFCVTQIAKTEDADVRARLREALVALDPISLPAVYEATFSENARVRTEAAYALGRLAELNRLRSGIAAALVAAPALTGAPDDPAGEAARWASFQMTRQPATLAGVKSRLDAAVNDLLDGQILFSADADRPDYEPPSDLAMRIAGRLAQDRADLDPTDRAATRRAVLLTLESGAALTDRLNLGAQSVSLGEVLGEALDRGLHTAARRCCEAIGERRDLAALAATPRGTAPLIRALDAPHPAVRFAAAQAALAIDPQQPYAGSSRLIAALDYFAGATGDPAAVVAYPQLAKAGQTAGWLIASGYAATPTNRGSEAVAIATASPDTELVLVDRSISMPDAREVLYRLRGTPATALVPVAVLAADGRLSEAQRAAEDHGGAAGRVIALPRPHSVEATQSLAVRLAQMLPADWPNAETRVANAGAARAALAELAADGPAFYALDRRALAGAAPR